MKSPTALVAEDEAVLLELLCEQLSLLWPELRIVARAANGLEALQAMERHRPDVLFLDIEMPGLSGLDLAAQADRHTQVVFVTAYDAHAVAAFERGAVDYVLKPYGVARMAESIRRVKERHGRWTADLGQVLRELAAASPPRDYLRWLKASRGSEVRLVTADEVLYFQADTKYTRVVTADGDALLRMSLRELSEQLDPAQFWWVHRSTIVNANAIAGVRRDLRGRLHVRLKHCDDLLPVSEPHESLFRQM